MPDAIDKPRGALVMFARAATKRCPWCGQGRLFKRWTRMWERCPRCGLRFEREEGSFLGSLTINYGVTAGAWIALMVVWLAVTLPHVAWLPLMLASAGVIVGVAVAFYPFAKTVWSAIDLFLHGMHRKVDPSVADQFGLKASAR